MKFHKETEFQETEIGEIPRDWKVVRLKDVAEIRGSRKVTQGFDTLIFIPMEAIPDDGVYAGFELRDANEVKSYVYCEPGDILLAKITPSFENGKQGIVPEEIPGKFALATTEVYPIKCKDVNKFFLFYLLKYPPLRNKLVSLMRGTTGRKRVPREALENQLIPYPPLKEQENIGKVLLTIQNLKESMRDAIDRLERLKRGLMGELLTGRIRVREENGRLSFYRETELQETEIGEIPRDWKVVEFGVLFDFQRGLSYRKNDISTFQTPIRFITINDLEKEGGRKRDVEPIYLSEELEDSIINKKCTVEMGDILIAITDMSKGFIIGAPLYIDETLRNQGETLVYSMDLVKILPKRSLNTKFYFYLLSWERVRKIMKSLARGTNVLHLDLNLTKKLKVIEPPLEEQGRIANILSTIDRTIELHHRGRERLERLKRGLMDLLLTGKVRVVDGDVGS
jgi:type I restriction enzyme S subunit